MNPLSTRHASAAWGRTNACYAHEMTDDDHRELAKVTMHLEGMVAISSYPSELYEELYADWECVSCEAITDSSSRRKEVLWLSPSLTEARQQLRLEGVI